MNTSSTTGPLSSGPVRPRLVIIGLGLIGSSLAAAVKQRQLPWEVIAFVRKQATADYALTERLIDDFVLSLDGVIPKLTAGDVIFIAVPVLSMSPVIEQIKDLVNPEVTITDAASVKGSVVDAVSKAWGSVPPQFVPGHPIAGSEKNGVMAANPNLYVDHRVILTPVEATSREHVQKVTVLWQSVGATVLMLPLQEHDLILAATSHLPHAIAYSLVDTLAKDTHIDNIFQYAAGGFRDFTRIAGSNPRMWHDIMCANQQAILKALDLFENNLSRLRQAIADRDSGYLLSLFQRAKVARDQFSAMTDGEPGD